MPGETPALPPGEVIDGFGGTGSAHDDRLPEAVRRLNLPATTFIVTRRANSMVEGVGGFQKLTRVLDKRAVLEHAVPRDERAAGGGLEACGSAAISREL